MKPCCDPVATEVDIATAVDVDCEQPAHETITEHAVVVEPDADVVHVASGEQGPPGRSAFDEWLLRHPGGTWDQFMSELGSGAIWHRTEW